MDPQEYIATGILELYVYGLLSEAENEEVYRMEMAHRQVEEEIVSIEKAIINISTTFSPFLSVDHFSRIKSELEIKHGKVSVIQPKSNLWQNVGWAAALVFFLGIGYFWYKQSSAEKQMLTLEKEKKLNWKKRSFWQSGNQSKPWKH